MKKIAIILSGQVRTFNISILNYLKNKNIDFDVYIHYWLPKNNTYNYCGNYFGRHSINNIPNNLHEKIIEYYNPKKIICEEQIDFSNSNNNMEEISSNTTQNTISQFYGIYKCFNQIENLDDYSHFIKIRFDAELKYFDKNINDINDEAIYFLFTQPHICDFIWLIPNKYKDILNLYNYIYVTKNKLNTIPELIIQSYISEFNINIRNLGGTLCIDRSYVKKGILHFHNGYEDIIQCIPLINYYCEKYNFIYLFIREDIKYFLDWYCKDIKNIHIIYISFDLHLKYFESIHKNNIDLSIENNELKYCLQLNNINNIDKIYIGFMDKCNNNYPNKFTEYLINNNKNFVRAFYEAYNINYDLRIKYFNIERDYLLEDTTYNEFILNNGYEYNLYCSCENRNDFNIYIKNKCKNPIDINNITNIFYNYIKILENAIDIHIIDSFWGCFIYILQSKYNLFKNIKIYYYPIKHNIIFYINEPLYDNWNIIDNIIN